MAGGRGGRGRGKVIGNAAMRTRGTMKIDPSTSNQPRKNTTQKRLPSQYQITPLNTEVTPPVPVFQPPPAPGVKSYPPPLILFNDSGASPSTGGQPTVSPQPRPQPQASGPTASSQPRRAAVSQPGPQPLTGPTASSQPRRASVSQPLEGDSTQPRVSASNPRPSTPRSSQAQNDLEEEDEEDYEEVAFDDDADKEPTLPEDVLAALHQMLTQPGRKKVTTVLSPIFEPETTW